MKHKPTRQQMINAEIAARTDNKKASKLLKRHTPANLQHEVKIAFQCECADENCRERISLTIPEYEKLHKNFARFVVTEGHVEPSVETVKQKGADHTVVEKFALS